MNNYLVEFKENIFETIFKISFKNWLKTTGAYAIMYGASIILVIAFFLVIISSTGIFSLSDLSNTQALAMKLGMFGAALLSPVFFISLAVTLIITIIISSWLTNFTFLLINNYVTDQDTDFGIVFKQSFSPIVFKLFGLILIFFAITVAGMGISVFLTKISWVLTVLGVIVLYIFLIRLSLAIPAFLIGNKSLNDSLSFSLEKMSWIRALKLFGLLILAFIGIFIVSFAISLVSFIFNLIPFIGPLFQMAIQVFLSSFMLALSTSAMIGLYYRYSEEPIENNSDFAPEVVDYTPTQE